MTGTPLSPGVRETLGAFLGPHPSSVLEVGGGPFVARGRPVHGRAAALPFSDATFDRIYCINALHAFPDRAAFFVEARRVLRPGGGLLTIDRDPHTDRDDCWACQDFEDLPARDRERFARVRTLRGEMALAGFAWTESMEADHLEVCYPAAEVLGQGAVDAGSRSQLALLSEEELARGYERLRRANDAAGGALQLVADVRFYATVGWVDAPA